MLSIAGIAQMLLSLAGCGIIVLEQSERRAARPLKKAEAAVKADKDLDMKRTMAAPGR